MMHLLDLPDELILRVLELPVTAEDLVRNETVSKRFRDCVLKSYKSVLVCPRRMKGVNLRRGLTMKTHRDAFLRRFSLALVDIRYAFPADGRIEMTEVFTLSIYDCPNLASLPKVHISHLNELYLFPCFARPLNYLFLDIDMPLNDLEDAVLNLPDIKIGKIIIGILDVSLTLPQNDVYYIRNIMGLLEKRLDILRLQYLRIVTRQLSNKSVEHLKTDNNGTGVSSRGGEDAACVPLPSLSSYLDLRGFVIRIASDARLDPCSLPIDLEILKIRCYNLFGCENLCNLPNLATLELSGVSEIDFDDDSFAQLLARSLNLHTLSIARLPSCITKRTVAAIARLRYLDCLELTESEIDEWIVCVVLKQSPGMLRLSIPSNKITDAILPYLNRHHSTLLHLNLMHTKCTFGGITNYLRSRAKAVGRGEKMEKLEFVIFDPKKQCNDALGVENRERIEELCNVTLPYMNVRVENSDGSYYWLF